MEERVGRGGVGRKGGGRSVYGGVYGGGRGGGGEKGEGLRSITVQELHSSQNCGHLLHFSVHFPVNLTEHL